MAKISFYGYEWHIRTSKNVKQHKKRVKMCIFATFRHIFQPHYTLTNVPIIHVKQTEQQMKHSDLFFYEKYIYFAPHFRIIPRNTLPNTI